MQQAGCRRGGGPVVRGRACGPRSRPIAGRRTEDTGAKPANGRRPWLRLWLMTAHRVPGRAVLCAALAALAAGTCAAPALASDVSATHAYIAADATVVQHAAARIPHGEATL